MQIVLVLGGRWWQCVIYEMSGYPDKRYPDMTFDAAYHSHVLEHMGQHEAISFIQECWRVLRPGGVLRIVVPDLEETARTYLQTLDMAREGDQTGQDNYQWMLLELFDQMTRHQSGGGMKQYLRQPQIPNEAFLCQRMGPQAGVIIEQTRSQRQGKQASSKRRIRRYQVVAFLRQLPQNIRRQIATRLLTSKDREALEVGRFRLSGEVHRWMYDEYSLGQLLESVGFTQAVRCTADKSAIDGWCQYNLDNDEQGHVRKPVSLFMEATRPEPE